MNQTMWLFIGLLAAAGQNGFAGDLRLWYEGPATEWTAGLPLGNGRLMAVVQGGVKKEIIQLNDDTLWTGQPVQRDKPGAARYLPAVRQLMFAGKYYEGEQLMIDKMQGLVLAMGMSTYQTLGNLELDFRYPETLAVADYYRELDMETAIATVRYRVGDATYTREVFVSPVDQALVVHLTCDQPGRLSLDVSLSRTRGIIERLAADRIAMHGVAKPATNAGWIGVAYETQLQVSAPGGTLGESKAGIRVTGANEVTLRLVAATDYRGGNPRMVCAKQLANASTKNFASLRATQVEEHQRLFKRVDLDLGPASKLPTDKRLEAFASGRNDPSLVALYFQFGRYLLMSSSRPGSMAINLWGKWVDGYAPAYDADYHININIQMNYWLTEICNLTECHEPFIDLLDNLRPRGRITAKSTFGSGGFTAGYATDAWYFTSSIGNPPYGAWPMAPAWMSQHLWEHYRFGGDKAYLATKSYPIMKEAAEFFIDYLVADPRTGYLVTGPSTSPENRFKDPTTGKAVSLSMAPTMDIQLVNDLFSHCIEASRVLGVDEAFRSQLQSLQARLRPMQIGDDGRLLEWEKPFEEHDKGHRHLSHLWGLCPGDQITVNTPALFAASRKSLDVRVEYGAANSPEYQGVAAWVMGCYTRLHDGEKAFGLLKHILAKSSWPNLFAVGERGRERKMFETDVNLGAAAAIAEMFLQSHDGQITLLPALPASLASGRVTGLRARGGFEVDLNWKEARLVSATIKSVYGGSCKLKSGNRLIEFPTEAGQAYHFDGSLKEKL